MRVTDEVVERVWAAFQEDPDPFADPSKESVRRALEAALSPGTPEEDGRAARQLGWYPEMPVDMARLREENEDLIAELQRAIGRNAPLREENERLRAAIIAVLRAGSAALSRTGEPE